MVFPHVSLPLLQALRTGLVVCVVDIAPFISAKHSSGQGLFAREPERVLTPAQSPVVEFR